jgi:rubrerythrin
MNWNRVFVVVVSLSVAAGVFAQSEAKSPKTTTGGKSVTVQTAKEAAVCYACPMCDVASEKPGKCPKCGMKMEPIQAKMGFTCERHHAFATKAGKCTKDGKALGKGAMTYACDKCHVTSTTPGKCPKCGKTMKKHVMPMVEPKK